MTNSHLSKMVAHFTAPVGHVVYVGCGLASDLDDYLALTPEKVWLIEPNFEMADDLIALEQSNDRVQFLPVAIATQSGEQPFHIVNFFDLSSLKTPSKLTQIYPGAKITQSPQVRALSLYDLLDQNPLPQDLGNILVIEAVGSEADIVSALEQTELADQFQGVVLATTKRVLFSGGAALKRLKTMLAAVGFELLAEDGKSNSDWTRTVFWRDATAVRFQTLEAELAAQKRQYAALEREHKALQSALEAREGDLATAKTRLNEHAVLQEQYDTLCKQVDTLQSQKDDAEEACNRQKSEVSLALRMQIMRDNDFRDLQTRFNDMAKDKKQLETLLGTVTNQLRAASHYVSILELGASESAEKTSVPVHDIDPDHGEMS
ncbi:MAG: hypothetical protein GJ677_02490 [Rhodobacteraceae bacterium]|nr:hypothetical protein [Paracoccaceae bacterium]